MANELFFKTTPYEHQREGVRFGMNHDRFFLGDDQGLGKTKQAIDIAINNKIYYGYKHCLIVCGVNTLKWTWYNECLTHSDEQPYIVGMRTSKRGKTKIGSVKDRIDDLYRIDELPYFLITNIETFRTPDFANKVNELCKDNTIQMCVFDECHKAKSPSATQTRGFMGVQCEYRMCMTGTPIMNSPLDMYIILKWLGLETHSYYQFEKHYAIKGGFGGYQTIGYKHLDQMDAMTKQIMLRRRKSEVLDLPEKTFVDEIVEMEKDQAKIYSDVLSDIKDNIDKVMLSPSPLSALIRLRQATGYTGILSSEVQKSVKLDRMEEIVENAVASDDKVIIFSNWTQITDEVEKRLEKYGVLSITGNTSEIDRKENIEKFQTDEDYKIIVGTIGAMGTGVTLTAAHTVIFLDEPWTKALYDQAVDRAHRIGQTENVTIYNIICKDTIDQQVHDLINKKGQVASIMIDSPDVQNKSEIVNFLLK